MSIQWFFRPVNGRPYSWAYLPDGAWNEVTVPGSVRSWLTERGVFGEGPLDDRAILPWTDQEFELRGQVASVETGPGWVRIAGLAPGARVHWNGADLGVNDSVFVPFEANVAIQPENELLIRFASLPRLGDRLREEFLEENGLPLDQPGFEDRSFLRHVHSEFGWDWGPRVPFAGVRGAVTFGLGARVQEPSVRVLARGDGRWAVEVDAGAEAVVTFCGERWTGPGVRDVMVDAEDVWRIGAGGRLDEVVIVDGGQTWVKRVGYRTVRLVQEGGDFGFEVNGERIWVGGANVIPTAGASRGQGDAEAVRQVEAAAAMGMTMLRVWGGGDYASEAFLDACDRLGILVWQDFMFACSYVPEDFDFVQAVEREAEYQVRRMAHRPCLALWCGNNENQMMHFQRWCGARTPEHFWGDVIYEQVLREVVAEWDGTRDYVAGSPIGGADANSETEGDCHYWNVWHGVGDWAAYDECQARFCSEFGFASAPAPLAGLSDEQIRERNRTGKPRAVWEELVGRHYPLDAPWFLVSQLNQRDAMRRAVEHFRLLPGCSGALIWQLGDVWTCESWSLIDGAERWKAAGFEMARLFAESLVSTRREGSGWVCRGIGEATVRGVVMTAEGQVTHERTWRADEPMAVDGEGLLWTEVAGRWHVTLDREPKEMAWPELTWERTAEGYRASGPLVDVHVRTEMGEFWVSNPFGELRLPEGAGRAWVTGLQMGTVALD